MCINVFSYTHTSNTKQSTGCVLCINVSSYMCINVFSYTHTSHRLSRRTHTKAHQQDTECVLRINVFFYYSSISSLAEGIPRVNRHSIESVLCIECVLSYIVSLAEGISRVFTTPLYYSSLLSSLAGGISRVNRESSSTDKLHT